MSGEVTIKNGSWCPICRVTVTNDCVHDVIDFNVAYAATNAARVERARIVKWLEMIGQDELARRIKYME